jgi:membrane protease YdiL (CAAX protease family)
MRRLIRALPVRVEASIVLVGAFGLFVLSSILAVVNPKTAPPITESHLRSNLIYETSVFLLLTVFLWLRDWTPARLGLKYQGLDALLGMALMMVTYAVFVAIIVLIGAFGYDIESLSAANLVAPDLKLVTVVVGSLVNALFEEVFVCAYPITVAKEHSRLIAGVNLSVAVRLAYHLYQGGGAVVSILPLGLIFAWFYAKTGRLWPLVIGHALFDVIALMQYVK